MRGEAVNEKIVRLVPKEIEAEFRFDPDVTLENMKGKGFEKVLVIGMLEDGACIIEGNCNSGECLFLMKRAEIELVGGNP